MLEGGSIASRGEYCDFGDGMVFAGAPVSLTEDGKSFLMTGGRISMAELEEGGMLAGDFYDAVGGRIEISGGEVFCVPEKSYVRIPTDGFYSYMDSRGSVSISGGYFDFEPDAEYLDDSMKAVESARRGFRFTVTDGSPDPWKDEREAQEENICEIVRSVRFTDGSEPRQTEVKPEMSCCSRRKLSKGKSGIAAEKPRQPDFMKARLYCSCQRPGICRRCTGCSACFTLNNKRSKKAQSSRSFLPGIAMLCYKFQLFAPVKAVLWRTPAS